MRNDLNAISMNIIMISLEYSPPHYHNVPEGCNAQNSLLRMENEKRGRLNFEIIFSISRWFFFSGWWVEMRFSLACRSVRYREKSVRSDLLFTMHKRMCGCAFANYATGWRGDCLSGNGERTTWHMKSLSPLNFHELFADLNIILKLRILQNILLLGRFSSPTQLMWL